MQKTLTAAMLMVVAFGAGVGALETRPASTWRSLRGGATASQAILLTSGSIVTLGGAKVVVDGLEKDSEQERDSATLVGLALLGWGASKFTSLCTGSETLYCQVNYLMLSLLAVTRRVTGKREPDTPQRPGGRQRSLIFRSLRILASLYGYVGFVRPWDGCVPRTLAFLAPKRRGERIELPAPALSKLHLA